MKRSADGHAGKSDLPASNIPILISIGHLGLDGDVNVKTVADHLHMSGAFVTTVTSKLQTLGLVEKTQDSVDRRRISLAITEKGRALLRKLAPYQREINDVEFGSLEPRGFQTMSRILEDLIASSDKAFALQRYKSSIKDSTKVALKLALPLRQIEAGQHRDQSRRLQRGRRLAE